MSVPREIGRVTWPGGKPTAILREDRTWSSDAKGLADALDTLYRGDYRGPSDGRHGVKILDDLAALVGGTSQLADTPDPPPGRVY